MQKKKEMTCLHLKSARQQWSTVFKPIDVKGTMAFAVIFFWVHARVYSHMVPALPLKSHLGRPLQLPICIPDWTGGFREWRHFSLSWWYVASQETFKTPPWCCEKGISTFSSNRLQEILDLDSYGLNWRGLLFMEPAK